MTEIEGSSWIRWIVPAAGVFAGALVVMCGRWLLTPRRRAAHQSAETSEAMARNILLQEPFVSGSRTERRGALRRGGAAVAVLISDAQCKGPPHQGWVMDRSTGGLRVAVNQAIPLGTILSLRPSHAPETTPSVQVEVTNCQECKPHWEIGCRFLRTPSWSVLLLFG